MGGGASNGLFRGTKGSFKPNRDGYFGQKGDSHTHSHVRHMSGGREGAKAFFDTITKEYSSETQYPNGLIRRLMSDGSDISYRPFSSSDGSYVVEMQGGTINKQRIHFVD